MPRSLLLALLCSLFVTACGGRKAVDVEAQRECAEAVERYSQLYVGKWGEHDDASFDEVLVAADRLADHVDEGRDDCRKLAGVADVIRASRAGELAVAGGASPPSVEMRAGHIFGFALMILGYIVSTVGGIWLIVVAFQQSVAWGLAFLFIPFANLYFVVTHWEEARTPFLVNAGAFLVLVLGLWFAWPYFEAAGAGPMV